MHDDVESGKSVPHWRGDFLSTLPNRSLAGWRRSITALRVVLNLAFRVQNLASVGPHFPNLEQNYDLFDWRLL